MQLARGTLHRNHRSSLLQIDVYETKLVRSKVIKELSTSYLLESMHLTFLVSAGYLCDLQGLFSEIGNLCGVNRNELQLFSEC